MTELPEGLLTAIDAYQSDPEWFPPQGTAGLRAMVRVDGDPSEADFKWVEAREVLIEEANGVWEEIAQAAPMPTTADVLEGGEVVYPEWVGTDWEQIMGMPWSETFPDALAEAKAYLEQTTGA